MTTSKNTERKKNMERNKKVSLVFPSPSQQYGSAWSQEKINHPLQSGLALLAKTLEDHCPNVDVHCFGNQHITGDTAKRYTWRYKTVNEFADFCTESDIVGISVILDNLSRGIELAEELKRRNPTQTIVFGGPSASYRSSARLLMTKKAIDYVVVGDGEQPLIDIVHGRNPADISNLFYKDNGAVLASKRRFVSDLTQRPIWDFSSTPDYIQVLAAFDSRTTLYKELRQEAGNFLGMVGVQFSTGCEKAETLGPCSYCVSARNPRVVLGDADLFWRQVLYLYDTHGITEYFIIDNVLAIPHKLDALLVAKERYSIPEEIQFRAYGYIPFFYQEGGQEMMRKLKALGVKNLFVGVENFDETITQYSNKPGCSYEQVHHIVQQATEEGIDTFLPFLIGLPGDSKESLEYNLSCFERLLSHFGSKSYGNGHLVRVDFSRAMPLRSTRWYQKLEKDSMVLDFYKRNTGIALPEHIDPNYAVLRDASLQFFHSTGLTHDDILAFRERFFRMCDQYIRTEQIGGFEPTQINSLTPTS